MLRCYERTIYTYIATITNPCFLEPSKRACKQVTPPARSIPIPSPSLGSAPSDHPLTKAIRLLSQHNAMRDERGIEARACAEADLGGGDRERGAGRVGA